MNDHSSKIKEAEKALNEGDIEKMRAIIRPLLEKNVAAAFRLNASVFEAGTPADECDRLYVQGILRAAELGDPVAKYQVGVFYDLGEYGIRQDKVRASTIFKELAETGDPHCMWIYACELIWGTGSFPKDTETGLRILEEAAEAGSANACMTIADFHHNGLFGYKKSIALRDRFRFLANANDNSTFDPYA